MWETAASIGYLVGVFITFDRVGQRFDPTGPAVDVAVGCVLTLAAAAMWPLAVAFVLISRIWPVRSAAPAERHRQKSSQDAWYSNPLEQLD